MPSHAARGRIHPTRSAAAGRPVDMWAAMPCPVAAAQVSLVARMSRANRLTVQVLEASHLRRVQVFGKQDPYVRAKLYFGGRKVGECRSSTHADGGKNPNWRARAKRVLTFCIPKSVSPNALSIKLDIINDNRTMDNFVGTTDRIAVGQVIGSHRVWWNVSTGGMLHAAIDFVRSDPGQWSPPVRTIIAHDRNNTATAPMAPPRPPTAPPPPPTAPLPAPFGGVGDGTRDVGSRVTDAELPSWAVGDVELYRWAMEIESPVGGAIGASNESQLEASYRPLPYSLGPSAANDGGFQASLAFPCDSDAGGDEIPIVYGSSASGGGGGFAAARGGGYGGSGASAGTGGSSPVIPEARAIPAVGVAVAEPYNLSRANDTAATTVPIWRAVTPTAPVYLPLLGGAHGGGNPGVGGLAWTDDRFGSGVVGVGVGMAVSSGPPLSSVSRAVWRSTT